MKGGMGEERRRGREEIGQEERGKGGEGAGGWGKEERRKS